MMRQVTLLILATITVAGCSASAQSTAKSSPKADDSSAPAPLQVELMEELNTAKLRPESTVFVRAIHDWIGPGCDIHTGAVLGAHVSRIEKETKESKGSSITLNFDRVDCDGHRSDLKLIIVAVVAMPWVDYGRALIESTIIGQRVETGDNAILGVAMTPTGYVMGFNMGVGGLAMSHPTFDTKNEKLKIPDSVQPGQVVGTKKITLGVEKGFGGDTVLAAVKGNILLQRSSQLVLLPKEVLHPGMGGMIAKAKPSPGGGAGRADSPTATTEPAEPAVPEVDETSICNASCTLVPEKEAPMPSKAALTLAVASLGYKPRDLGTLTVNAFFNYDSTLSYLNQNSILFTYDPHDLRHRYRSGYGTEAMRRVRAVVLDRADLSVKRMVDWQVEGEGQYLWRLGDDGVLVHIGHSLRLLGPDLTPIREINVPGKLVFVSISPSGDHIAVGTVSELHSREMHQQLIDNLGGDPDEGVNIQIFDKNFKLLFVAHQNSAALHPPILSNGGEIRLNYAGKSHWKIQEIRWDHTVQTIATVISHCPVSVDTPRPDALFVVGCTTSESDTWYRILRLDGHLILSGHGPGLDAEQCFSSTHGDFAVRMVIPKTTGSRKIVVYKDLEEQQVGIYRVNDGKRLFSTVSPGVSLTQQSFALSPQGDQLAVLSDRAISVYQVPQPER